MDLKDLLINMWGLPEEDIEKIMAFYHYDSYEPIYSKVHAYIENAGGKDHKAIDVSDVSLKDVFPEVLKIDIDKLRERLPMIKDYKALTDITRDALTDITSWEEKNQAKSLIQDRARALKKARNIAEYIRVIEKGLRETTLQIDKIERDNSGNVKKTIQNYLEIFELMDDMKTVWFDLIRNTAMHGAVEWRNVDDSATLNYIEQTYGLSDETKYNHALRIFLSKKEINPLAEMLNGLAKHWDGQPRCERFLTEIAQATADDQNYVREVSKRIFDAGVNRIYNPGCKCDEMPVLIGKQGSGKSRLVQYLALHDDYYYSIPRINYNDMDDTFEKIAGHFIIEFAEVYGSMKREEQDILKDFLAKQKDVYRTPFDRRPETYPRRCIFIGTTNNSKFLTDLTGNRRFLPVRCNCDVKYVYEHENEIRDFIEQCYGEAAARYQNGERLTALSDHAQEVAEKLQAASLIEDWDRGIIEDWIDKLPRTFISGIEVDTLVCGKMVWERALQHDASEYRKSINEIRRIAGILDSLPNLEPIGRHYVKGYGQQEAYKKKF